MRGLQWHNFRNVDGVYNKDISDDPNKMIELNAYLDFLKDKDAKKVHNIFLRYRTLDLQNPRNKETRMDEVAKELDDLTKSKGKK